MIPPKFCKSVTVSAEGVAVKIMASYVNNAGNTIEEVMEIPEGGSHTFPEKIENMGTWQAVMKITELTGEADGDSFSHEVGPHCQGIHANIHFSIHPKGELKLKART